MSSDKKVLIPLFSIKTKKTTKKTPNDKINQEWEQQKVQKEAFQLQAIFCMRIMAIT